MNIGSLFVSLGIRTSSTRQIGKFQRQLAGVRRSALFLTTVITATNVSIKKMTKDSLESAKRLEETALAMGITTAQWNAMFKKNMGYDFITNEQIRDVRVFERLVKATKVAFAGLRTQALVAVLPKLTRHMNRLLGLFQRSHKEIVSTFAGLLKFGLHLTELMTNVGVGLTSIITKVSSLRFGLLGLSAVGFGILVAFKPFWALWYGIFLVFDDIYSYVSKDGRKSIVGAIVDFWKAFDKNHPALARTIASLGILMGTSGLLMAIARAEKLWSTFNKIYKTMKAIVLLESLRSALSVLTGMAKADPLRFAIGVGIMAGGFYSIWKAFKPNDDEEEKPKREPADPNSRGIVKQTQPGDLGYVRPVSTWIDEHLVKPTAKGYRKVKEWFNTPEENNPALNAINRNLRRNATSQDNSTRQIVVNQTNNINNSKDPAETAKQVGQQTERVLNNSRELMNGNVLPVN